MGGEDLVNEVLALKRERNAVILAHNYMDYDIQAVADFTGDSYDLAGDLSLSIINTFLNSPSILTCTGTAPNC